MKKLLILLLGLPVWPAVVVRAQPAAAPLSVGLELDVLPYATGGYFGAVWIGKGHWRGRVLAAQATKPDFLLPDDYTDNRIRAYAVLADYFPKQNFRGWWLAAGLVYWDGRIRHEPTRQTGAYQSYLLSGGLGYNWMFFRHFYLSPWIGLHVRVAGDGAVDFPGGVAYEPPRFNPEGSLKVGWYF